MIKDILRTLIRYYGSRLILQALLEIVREDIPGKPLVGHLERAVRAKVQAWDGYGA